MCHNYVDFEWTKLGEAVANIKKFLVIDNNLVLASFVFLLSRRHYIGKLICVIVKIQFSYKVYNEYELFYKKRML